MGEPTIRDEEADELLGDGAWLLREDDDGRRSP